MSRSIEICHSTEAKKISYLLPIRYNKLNSCLKFILRDTRSARSSGRTAHFSVRGEELRKQRPKPLHRR
jgi:hypothetical protein